MADRRRERGGGAWQARQACVIGAHGKPSRLPTGNKALRIPLSTKQGRNHASHLRIHLESVTRPLPRCNGAAGGRAMIELSAAILGLISVAIFAAHALDAYRTH
jgi:hypothetical protein